MLKGLTSYINDNYGSKRGLIESSKYFWLHRIGYLRELGDIDFSRVTKLVFVCSGNLCRSPIGEYHARKLGVEAESYGLHCRGGDPADPRALAYGRNLGLDLSLHITKNIKDYQASTSDLVIAMEPKQADTLKRNYNLSAQITLASLWRKNPTLYLHDPFGSTPEYFETCGNRVSETVDFLLQKLD